MSTCPYKSFTTDLAASLKELASAMSKVADAMEICHEASTFARPPPIDTATPAAAKAAQAMEDEEEVDAANVELTLMDLHKERKAQMRGKATCDLDKCWNGGWITVHGKAYQIYRYQLYHYDKKEHCINHYGHYNPIQNSVVPDMLVPNFKDAPRGYSARSALY